MEAKGERAIPWQRIRRLTVDGLSPVGIVQRLYGSTRAGKRLMGDALIRFDYGFLKVCGLQHVAKEEFFADMARFIRGGGALAVTQFSEFA